MKYSDENIYLGEIKAETLISQMDTNENQGVRMHGIFSRNYEEDLISIIDEEDKTIFELSRDSIFHLLPESLFFNENQLKKESKPYFDFEKEHAEMVKQKKAILSFFSPFDTEYFKLSLELEKSLNKIAVKGNHIFINLLEIEPEIGVKNEYISKIKVLLPFVSQIRGNHLLIVDIIKNVLSAEKIEVEEKGAFHKRFIIHKEGLSKEEYRLMDEGLIDFFNFLRQWFLPVEVKYDYRIKDYKNSFTLGTTLLLDYNTHFKYGKIQ